jgi:DNA-binding CsgD family transcriptional regulator/predicted ester cyclase
MHKIKNQIIIEHVIYEFLGKSNLSRYDQFVDMNVQVHNPASGQKLGLSSLNGIENTKQIDRHYSEAFKIQKIEIDDLFSERDKILVRWNFKGIHRGDFFSLKASNAPITLTGQTIYRFNSQEKIQEVWQSWDLLGLVQQSFPENKKLSLLSQKERECLKHFLSGKTAKETAICMKLSFRTIEYYFENIKSKLGCLTKRELYTYAQMNSLEYKLSN